MYYASNNNRGSGGNFHTSGGGGGGGGGGSIRSGDGATWGFGGRDGEPMAGGGEAGRQGGGRGRGEGGISYLTHNEPSAVGVGLSPAEIAPMLSGAVFTVREKGRAEVKPQLCSLWLGRQKPHVLNYRCDALGSVHTP